MPATFGSAVTVAAKTVVDTAASQGTGAACTGINFASNAASPAGVDEATIANCRIGSAADTSVHVESGDGVGI